ncbi:proteoglycan 4b isoform X2 [Hypanus sabinus]|uniref:proteoglycan 4b isoform X2 n=1 Tax=Hypanus sabinus TaxID=79690 RepID=UPI0028C4E028|nr:proteoglycan 4b isoform X2 [Hypanus sabinus]
MANPQNLITWQTILLTVSSLNLLKVIETQDSCRGRCASVYDRNSKCHCDSECIRYGECCEDYRTICTSETSCSGRCFEQHERGRKCQCDPSCMNYGDCCSDFVANCEKDTWKNPAFMATTRASLVFTSSTRKPTAEKPEFISDTLPQQDAASFSDDNAKIKEESMKLNYSTNSKIMHKGLTTSPIPQDVPTDSKILDKGLTTNTDPEEVTANPRVLESVKTTSALPEAASTNARISGKGMASLSVPVPSPTRSDIMVTEPTHERRNQITGKTQSYEDILNDSNLCNKKPSDAMTTLQNGTTYIFRGHLFWTISQKGQILGHPQRISDVWGIPSPIDTVFTRCNCLGNTYFFKGDQYWRFQNGHMDSGYPRKIAAGFSGLSGEITVALSVAAYRNRPETVYFFKKGGLYQKYVYQRPITSCPLERTHSPIYQVARRYRRQTMVAMQKSRKLQNIAQLSVEMSIRKNWHGFPLTVTSAISIPNPGLPEKYEYYVISHAKSYRVDPVNQKATYMKRSITKDVYKCL